MSHKRFCPNPNPARPSGPGSTLNPMLQPQPRRNIDGTNGQGESLRLARRTVVITLSISYNSRLSKELNYYVHAVCLYLAMARWRLRFKRRSVAEQNRLEAQRRRDKKPQGLRCTWRGTDFSNKFTEVERCMRVVAQLACYGQVTRV
ncbi:hypothetical protein RRG08_012496 [Elysia crispata]|uniref:Uncharacterized protein n=1 Tax=Elysia crispata TaxID=231223 RepID=A0AAE1E1W7_9GAST|nr:hypothetical protein RRG08_012496 [Elysia crispata]